MDILDMKIIAAAQVDVRYTGKEAHAAAFPEEGVNAADALTVAQVAIGLLRQHIRATDRVHGITTLGGAAPNVIPAETTAHYMARSATIGDLDELKTKVERCFEAGALATGSTLDLKWRGRDFAEMQHDLEIAEVYRRNSEALGRPFPDLGPLKERLMASTDMGNISLAVASIHPMVGIESLPATNHQPGFAAHCATEAADRAVVDGAVAMAWTAIDLAADETIRPRLLAHPVGS
jgi:metal-dependent amidase/aminoacylase/carboxypeptidase family protein